MPPGESVTHWIDLLKAGDPVAAQKLWERYFARLVGLARKKLQGARRCTADEEDVALSAFDSLCRGAVAGRFPQLADRDNLWRLLVVITARKAIDLVNWERRLKRGGGKVEGESAFPGAGDSSPPGLDQVVGDEPTPEFAAQVAEQCQQLLDQLGDDELRSIAVWKMEGYTNEEIAPKLCCAPVSVERPLRRIRKQWREGVFPDPHFRGTVVGHDSDRDAGCQDRNRDPQPGGAIEHPEPSFPRREGSAGVLWI